MPIKVPNNLPAIDTLEKENVFVMTDTRAMTQDMRPLRILLLNLMPTKIETETQLTRLLGNTPLQIELELLQTATHKVKVAAEEHMIAFYKTFEDVKDAYYDGLIITGAPIEQLAFEEVEYWDELCTIMEWSKTHVHSTFHICWGAQAGLYYHYGIEKIALSEKLSGVFLHSLDRKNGMLFRGFDDHFFVPHSRHTGLRREDVEAVDDLEILASSEKAGIFCIKSKNSRQIFVTGHLEYDADTLKNEYLRDLERGLSPHIPENYFPEDDASKDPIVTWRSCGNLLYSNWLNYFVYQSTPYDIRLISNEDLAPVLQNRSQRTVAKFGGSSLATAEKIRRVGEIIQSDPARRFVVVSAQGRRFPGDEKVTDLLIAASMDFEVNLCKVEERLREIHGKLDLRFDLEALFTQVREEYHRLSGLPQKLVRDYLASRGEYFSAKILADYLGYDFVDAKELILFRKDGTLAKEETRGMISAELRHHEQAVIPGFYGADDDGRIHTFSRGGSDISGSLIAEAVKADLYENWSDVEGFLMADPTLVASPIRVPLVTYQEVRELAHYGAQVLHEDALSPVRERGIPINIRSVDEPKHPGTLIVKNADFYETVLDISGISGSTGYASILLQKENISDDREGRRRLTKVLREYGITLFGEQVGLDSLALIVKEDDILSRKSDILPDLKDATGCDAIEVSGNLASIAVVGRNIAKRATVAMTIFKALSDAGINVRFIDHGTDRISVNVGIDKADYKRAVKAVYSAFIQRRKESV